MRGSRRAKARKNEPQPAEGRPVCPRDLSADAKKVWAQLIPQLDKMGVLARCDANALVRYCELWVRWRRAAAFLAKHGEHYAIHDEVGNFRCFMPWPEAATVSKLSVLLLRLEQEFGLTPAARTAIKVKVDEPEDDPLAQLLNEKKRRSS